MSLIQFNNLPNTDTPINAENLNHNFNSVVESGDNENGRWVKFADGTMICHASYYIERAITGGWGALYMSSSYPLKDFPMPFINTPTVDISYTRADWAQYHFIIGNTKPTATNAGSVFLVSPISQGQIQGGDIEVIAIGKWE